MAYVAFTSAEVQVDQPVNSSMMGKMKDNFDYLYSQSGGVVGINNPSFEIDADADKIPDNWTVSLFSGGAASITTVSSYVDHGGRAFRFTHPGGNSNGGGMLKSDYVGCSTGQVVQISFSLQSSPINCRSKVQAEWYKNDFSTIGGISTIFDSSALSTSYKRYRRTAQAPTSAKWMTVNLIGGTTESTVAGAVYFDNIGADVSNLLDAPTERGGNIIGGSQHTDSTSGAVSLTPTIKTIEVKVPGDYRISAEIWQTNTSPVRIYHGSCVSCVTVNGSSFTTVMIDSTGLNIGDKIYINANFDTTARSIGVRNLFLLVKHNGFCIASTSSVTT